MQDGPLTIAARLGAICYLDEVVEARQDTLVVIHPLTDDRRLLSLPARSEALQAHPEFFLVVSHNPGYQSALKDLKPSTKQRFGAIEFDYPARGSGGRDPGPRNGLAEGARRTLGFAGRSGTAAQRPRTR